MSEFRGLAERAVQQLRRLSSVAMIAAAVFAVTAGRPAAADMLTLTNPLSSAEYGQPVTFTALIRPDFMATLEPTGTVAFLANSFPVQFPNNNIPTTQLAAGIPISLSTLFGCMLTNTQPVCWGANDKGQFGNGITSVNPGIAGVFLPPFPPVTSIATGKDFTCAVVGPPATTVKCWGNNDHGQLGNTFTNDRVNPTDVVDLNMTPMMVAAGAAHACALSTTGTVKCWGSNTHGQLGTGNFFTPRTSPVDVVGLTGVISIAARDDRTCAVTGSGGLKCWGEVQPGLLAGGGNLDRNVPTEHPGLSSGVAAVSMGLTHNCVLTTGGGVKCWGYNTHGELGDDSINDSFGPVDVVGLGSGVASVAVGLSHSCALLNNGGVKCWGANDLGQLGIGAVGPDQHLPVNYATNLASGATTLAAGGNQNCATMQVVGSIAFTGGVKCWGDNNGFQTGVGNAGALLPTPVFQGSPDPFNQPGSQAATYLKATFTTSSLPVGTYTIDASFTGTTNFSSASSPQISFTITPGTTTTMLAGGLTPILAGEEATFVATVTATGNTAGGAVYFYDGATQLGFAFPVAGVATFKTTKLPAGMRTITASYTGDMGHSASTSAPVLQTVTVNGSTTGISATPNPSRPGQSVTFTANVAAEAPAPGVAQDGTVTFKDGTTTIGTVPVTNGTAQLTTSSLLLGAHTITAQYGASPSFTASSNSLSQLVEARVGAEMRISRFNLSGLREQPAAARIGARFIIVWQSDAQDGSGSGIFGQRYKNDGSKLGGEFKINTTTAKDQTLPAVAGFEDGSFVVTWASLGQDGSGTAVVAQRFGSNGVKIGGELLVNTTTRGSQSRPAVAALANGGFVIAWDAGDSSGLGVFARRFDKIGRPLGAEFQVNTFTAGNQTAPAVAATGSSFVIAWQSDTQDKGAGVYAQRFNANGSTAGFEFRVNSYSKSNQTAPAIATLSDQGFVIVWTSEGQDGDGLGIYGQRFLPTGNRNGEEFSINTTTALNQWQPAISPYDSGGFVVVWSSQNQDGDGQGVFGQAFNADGTRANGEFRANTTIARNQWQPSVATLTNGSFIAAWSWRSPDGSTQGIYGQRLSVETH